MPKYKKDLYLKEDDFFSLILKEEVVRDILQHISPSSIKNGIKYYSMARFQYTLGEHYKVSLIFDNNYIPFINRQDPIVSVLYGESGYSVKNITLLCIGFFPGLSLAQLPYIVKLIFFFNRHLDSFKYENVLNMALSVKWKKMIEEILEVLLKEKKIEKKQYGQYYRYYIAVEEQIITNKNINMFKNIHMLPQTKEDCATVDFIIFAHGYSCSYQYFKKIHRVFPDGPPIRRIRALILGKRSLSVIRKIQTRIAEFTK